jgi:hypothetical protein
MTLDRLLDRLLGVVFRSLSVLAIVVSLLGLFRCVQWIRHGSWRDASSPTIDLAAAPQGVWEHRWGESGSHEDRRRHLTLRNVDGTYLNWPDSLRFEVRITPRSALEQASAARATADGWVACTQLRRSVSDVGFDPTNVERIEWRATPGSAPSASTTPPFVLFVPGLADSEGHGGWIADAAFAVAGAGAAIAFAWVARQHA